MERRIEFPPPWQVAAPDGRQKLSRRLRKTFVPAALLYPPAGQAVGQLARHGDGDEVQGTPSSHLGAVAEVEILGQCIAMPSTRSLDRGSSPNAAGPVEGEELTRPASRRLLNREMAFENDLLRMCHAVLPGIQEVASGLNKGEMGVIEQGPKTESQKIGWRNVIGIENGYKRLPGTSEPGPQGPSFETGAMRTLD